MEEIPDLPIQNLESLSVVNLANNIMETRHCNLSEILQQPGPRILTLNPVQLQPVYFSNINTLPTLVLEKLVDGNQQEGLVQTENVIIPASTNQLELIEIVVSAPKKTEESVTQETRSKPIPNFKPIPDRKVLPRAQAVLPQCLQYRRGSVSPKTCLPEFALFGPVEGIVEKLSRAEARHLVSECVFKKRPVFLIPNEDGSFMRIDVSDQDKSNWIGLLSLGNDKTDNIWLHHIGNKIYAVTTKAIPPKKALAIGYTRDYAIEVEIPDGQPILDLNEELKRGRKEWRCEICDLTISSLVEWEVHDNKFHKKEDEKRLNRQKYRCRLCARRFSRIFCLRRHFKLCSKKKNKSNSNISSNDSLDVTSIEPIESTQMAQKKQLPTNEEEPRLPSDESLQNFTSMLDFSTNLFDTDRMLDCSLKSDEFNSIALKDDLVSDFKFPDELFCSSPKKPPKKTNVQQRPSTPFSCPYCKERIVRSKYRQHSRSCTARQSTCFCGKRFRHNKSLSVHMLKEHRTASDSAKRPIRAAWANNRQKTNNSTLETKENAPQTYDKVTQNESQLSKIVSHVEEAVGIQGSIPETDGSLIDNNKYKCQQCTSVFKRRGMLVNHLSRAHAASAAAVAVPLVVTEKRYPCPGCPKVYSAASKRKAHIDVMHPGLKSAPLQSISVARRSRAPARCWACPRQYATRAKLLQHARDRHPNDVPPPPPEKKNKIK